jgi:hypothetical protein
VVSWSRTVDDGRRTTSRHSGGATGRIGGWRSVAAGRLQEPAMVVDSPGYFSAYRLRARSIEASACSRGNQPSTLTTFQSGVL